MQLFDDTLNKHKVVMTASLLDECALVERHQFHEVRG
jgi:hypothetical protein